MKLPSFCFVLLSAAQLVCAATINFEQVVGTVPFEGMAISNQFRAYYGMSFRAAGLAFPSIARVGWPQGAFDRSGLNESDTVRSSDAGLIGQFFLTDNPAGSNILILDFAAPVSQANGYILDIDAGERVTISVYSDATTNVVDSLWITSASPNTGDGIATFWSFNRPSRDILRIEFVATGPMGYDLLSSNYTPPPAPEPTLQLRMYPGVTISGEVGRPYRLYYADSLDRTPTGTNWHALDNLFLPYSPYLYFDPKPIASPERYYRALALP